MKTAADRLHPPLDHPESAATLAKVVRELDDSERCLRRFAENYDDLLWIGNASRDGFDYLSPAYERMWGRKGDDFEPTYRYWAKTLHPDDRPKASAWMASLHNGEAKTLQYRIIRSDGATREIRDAAFPICDQTGKVYCIGGIARDVTRMPSRQVYVVGGKHDPARCLVSMLECAGYRVTEFPSSRSFLNVVGVLRPGCVLLDSRPPNSTTMRVLREVRAQGGGISSIVIGPEEAAIGQVVTAMKCGASDYLGSEYTDEMLLESVDSVMRRLEASSTTDHADETGRQRIANLSTREREVLAGLLAGGSNKTIARKLGISHRTVELHRAHLMDKVGAHSLQELFHAALAAGFRTERRSAGRPQSARGTT